MRCRYCHGTESKVVDSRPTDDGTSIRRRRECMSCGRRFTTYEKIEEIPIMVVKKDGRRETFDSGVLFFYTHGHHYGVKMGSERLAECAGERGADG